MARDLKPEDFLELRLGLEDKIFGSAASPDDRGRAADPGLGVIDNGAGLVDVRGRVQEDIVADQV